MQLIYVFICLLFTGECTLDIKWKTQKQHNGEVVKDFYLLDACICIMIFLLHTLTMFLN